MKRTLLTILSVLFCAITFAQSVPQGINYQAVARDASGAVLMNQALTIQFSVISDITTSMLRLLGLFNNLTIYPFKTIE